MDINDVCQVCKQTNDDMLMLSCVHNPCVNCAASAYAEIVHIKNGNPNVCIYISRSTYVKYVGKKQYLIQQPSHN